MRIVTRIAVLAIAAGFAATVPAFADTYNFTITEPAKSIDLTFSLPSSPTGVTVGSDFFEITNVAISDNGGASAPGNIFFIDNPPLNGVYLTLSLPSLNLYQIEAPVLFTGSLSAPTFKTGTFVGVDDSATQDAVTVTIGSAAAPEPSSFALLGTGLLGFAGIVRRRAMA